MTTITIDGPTVKREDGTVRCVGYIVDDDGRVVKQFALTQGSELDVPDATTDVEYVNSMSDLPGINSHYLTG